MNGRILLAGGPGRGPGFIDWSRTVEAGELGSDRSVRARSYVLVLDDGDPEATYEALRRIRQHPLPGVYLTPVIVATAGGDPPPSLEAAADFVWARGGSADTPPDEVLTAVKRIDRFISRYEPSDPRGDRQLGVRLLRFMASRPGQFEPERTPRHPGGFVYPRLAPFLDGGTAELPELLEALESRRLLNGTFVTNAYFCTYCSCAFLNFEETCPECGSVKVEADDWIHHFRCAHTGPRSEFEDGPGLTCPECGRELRQLGVDYGRPSVSYSCLDCGHAFENPDVTATCYDCGRTAPPKEQDRRAIKSFTVTALGENTARHGVDRPFVSAIREHGRALDYDTFRTVLEGESARLERYGRSESSLLLVLLDDTDRLQVELGVRAKEVFDELTQTFTRIVRTSDYLTARSESLFLVLLTETDVEDARHAEERLRDGVRGVLESAGGVDDVSPMRTAVREVGPELDVQDELDAFLEGAVEDTDGA